MIVEAAINDVGAHTKLEFVRDDTNGSSPTGVQEVNALDGVCIEAQVMDAVEARLRARAGDG